MVYGYARCSTIVDIAYKHKVSGYTPRFGVIQKPLPELFKIIATQMMDVALTENGIESTLLKSFFPELSYQYSFVDPQFVKKILNQLKALNLLYSNWSNENSTLFWGLTTKGELERNKMILVRMSPKNEE